MDSESTQSSFYLRESVQQFLHMKHRWTLNLFKLTNLALLAQPIEFTIIMIIIIVFIYITELKDGRLPNGFDSRLNFWKAEELHKFTFPASEVIFADLLEDMDNHIWFLTARMTELVFSKRDGWSYEDLQLFSNLADRYLILVEEHRGLTSCVVTEHNLIHIASDVMRFSHPDNYWCFPFERAVRRYVTTKSNFKNIECTYAKKEARRELLKHLSSYIQGPPKQYKFSLEKVANSWYFYTVK